MNDAHLIERQLTGQQVYRGHFLDVRRDTISLPDGATSAREYIVHPGAVMVVPAARRRPAGDGAPVPLPVGAGDAGVPRRQARRRRDRAGMRPARAGRGDRLPCQRMGRAPAWCTTPAPIPPEGIEIWFARGLVAGERQLDQGEFLDVCLMTEAQIDALAGRGELTDVKTLIGLQWLQKWRAGLWVLDWMSVP